MLTAVACKTCDEVLWADNDCEFDVAAVANLLKLPCPRCGDVGTFAGYRDMARADLVAAAERVGWKWRPSDTGRWFDDKTTLEFLKENPGEVPAPVLAINNWCSHDAAQRSKDFDIIRQAEARRKTDGEDKDYSAR